MMRTVLGMVVGLAVVIGGCALAKVIKVSAPDDALIDLFAMSQVVILALVGLSIFADASGAFRQKPSRASAKRRTRAGEN